MWTKILPDIASIHMKETKKTYWIQIQIKWREEKPMKLLTLCLQLLFQPNKYT